MVRRQYARAAMGLGLCALASCGSSPSAPEKPTSPDDPYEGQKIQKVEITGNEALSDSDIIDGLATHGPTGILFKDHARYDPVAAQLDRDRIEAYYARKGYFGADVTDLDVRRCNGGVAVWFRVREGQPAVVSEVRIDGAGEALPTEAARDLVTLERGDVFVHQDYLDAKDRFRDRLKSRGYARAEVGGEAIVDRDQRTVKVRYELRPGPLVHFGRTMVTGTDRIPESVVRNRIAWSPGERYSPDLIEQTRGRLYALGFLDGVRIDLLPQERDGISDVVIRIHEGPRKEVRLGFGAAVDNANWEVRGRAGYTIHGLGDPLLTLDADAQPAYTVLRNTNEGNVGGQARVAVRRPDLLVPLLETRGEAWYDFIQLDAYDYRGPGFGLALGRPFFDRALHIVVGWWLRWVDFSDVHPGITPEIADEIGLVEPYRLGRFDQTVALDRRDELLDPHEGYFLQLRAEEAGAYTGSLFDYVMLTGEARGYVSPWRRWVLAARGVVGSAISGSLPATQRYFGGGASSHRGFGQRELAPFVTDPEAGEAAVGGEGLLETSVEVRVDVRRLWGSWIGVVAFLDGGDVTNAFDEIDLTNLHWAPGLGLRYDTIVGPIRFDVGYRVTRTGPGNPQAGDDLAFHLSLGEAF